MITIFIAYLLGSIPFGFLIGKLNGLDVRKAGSGNIGATNVFRLGGKLPGFMTLLLDLFKGGFAVYIAFLYDPAQMNFAAIAVVIGHIYPIWLNFNGGKGVASAAGAIFGLNLHVFCVAIASWVLTFLITRISSLSSLLACFFAGVGCMFFSHSLEESASIMLIVFLVLLRHKENILRLLRKQEGRL